MPRIQVRGKVLREAHASHSVLWFCIGRSLEDPLEEVAAVDAVENEGGVQTPVFAGGGVQIIRVAVIALWVSDGQIRLVEARLGRVGKEGRSHAEACAVVSCAGSGSWVTLIT